MDYSNDFPINSAEISRFFLFKGSILPENFYSSRDYYSEYSLLDRLLDNTIRLIIPRHFLIVDDCYFEKKNEHQWNVHFNYH